MVDMNGALGLVSSHMVPALNRSKRRGKNYGVSAPGGVFTPIELGTGLVAPPAPALDVPADALSSLTRFVDVPERTEFHPLTEPRRLDLVFERVYDDGRELSQPSRAEFLQGLVTRVRNLHVLGGAGVETLAEALRNAEVSRGWYSSTNGMYEVFREIGDRTLSVRSP
jgi:hypothetical protein